jgi:hypothetical protein
MSEHTDELTADGYPIVQGMRVWTNNLDAGWIDLEARSSTNEPLMRVARGGDTGSRVLQHCSKGRPHHVPLLVCAAHHNGVDAIPGMRDQVWTTIVMSLDVLLPKVPKVPVPIGLSCLSGR